MDNYNLKLNLAKLPGFGKTTLTGRSGKPKRCIVLPIEDNHIFEGDSGVYLDLVCFASDKLRDGKTHFVKRSKSKEEQEQEKASGEKLDIPIIGDMKPFSFGGGNYTGGEEYSTGASAQTAQQPAAQAAAPATKEADDDELPF